MQEVRVRRVRPGLRWAGWLVGLASIVPLHGGPTIRVVKQDCVVLEIRPLTARQAGGTKPVTLEVTETAPAEVELRLLWPDPGSASRLRLRATSRMPMLGFGQLIRLDAELIEPGGRTTRATRDLVFGEDSAPITALFEVARAEGKPLTLAIAGEISQRTTLLTRPVIGPPVQFLLEIEWFEGGSSVALEKNELHTFVGEAVTYSFQLGRPSEAESGSVRLLPSRLVGDTLRISVDLSGTLPDREGSVAVISRTEEWLTSSGMTFSLDLETGDPPRGYRFRVTPRF